MEFSFFGAAETVTGSKHVITLRNGKKILLDCGLYQGGGAESDRINRDLGFEASEIDYLILSHAHIDHSGLIPKLVKDGFNGPIYCTPATYDLCRLMLTDSAYIQESDANYINKKRAEKHKKPITPLYAYEDVAPALDLFKTIPYNEWTYIDEHIRILFTDAGHIIGSACVNLIIHESERDYRIAFTGDIGRYNNRILKQPQPFPQSDYIICESTYGDRLHESFEQVEEILLETVIETCVMKRGRLIIPAFSVGRTQEIVNVLNNLEFEGKLPTIPVYVDSPMATSATKIIRKHTDCYNDDILKYMKNDPSPFSFDNLHYVKNVKESIALNDNNEPCIIISASGMMEAGRVKHHLKHNIQDPRTTILIVGWCTPSSLGGRLINGDSQVSIFGEMYDVNADIIVINPFSAHGDYQEMLNFLSCQDTHKVEKVFLVHGEEKILPVWRDKLLEKGFTQVVIPTYKSTHPLP